MDFVQYKCPCCGAVLRFSPGAQKLSCGSCGNEYELWKYDLKQKASDFQSVELYVKPEENVVYYVINGEVQGNFGI